MAQANHFWMHPGFPDVALFRAHFRSHRYDLHTHPTYVVALITEGCERVRIGRRSVVAPAGSVFVVNPEEWHDGEAGVDTGWGYRTFYPSIELINTVADELGQPRDPLFPRTVLHDRRVARALAVAHAQSLGSDRLAAQMALLMALRGLFFAFAGRFVRPEPVEGSGAQQRMTRYIAALDQGLGEAPDLEQLAAIGSVTRFQVIRDFKNVAGVTPARYVRDRRLRQAHLLITSGATLAEAAHEAGFADQSHMTRTFRAARGITPGALLSALGRRP